MEIQGLVLSERRGGRNIGHVFKGKLVKTIVQRSGQDRFLGPVKRKVGNGLKRSLSRKFAVLEIGTEQFRIEIAAKRIAELEVEGPKTGEFGLKAFCRLLFEITILLLRP